MPEVLGLNPGHDLWKNLTCLVWKNNHMDTRFLLILVTIKQNHLKIGQNYKWVRLGYLAGPVSDLWPWLMQWLHPGTSLSLGMLSDLHPGLSPPLGMLSDLWPWLMQWLHPGTSPSLGMLSDLHPGTLHSLGMPSDGYPIMLHNMSQNMFFHMFYFMD